jgi:hypothetical protein
MCCRIMTSVKFEFNLHVKKFVYQCCASMEDIKESDSWNRIWNTLKTASPLKIFQVSKF